MRNSRTSGRLTPNTTNTRPSKTVSAEQPRQHPVQRPVKNTKPQRPQTVNTGQNQKPCPNNRPVNNKPQRVNTRPKPQRPQRTPQPGNTQDIIQQVKIESQNSIRSAKKIKTSKMTNSDLNRENQRTKIIEKQKRKKKRLKSVVMVLVSLILLAGGGYGGYLYMQKNKQPTLEDIRPQIIELYTDNQKSELKQATTIEAVNELLKEIDEITIKESEVADKEGFVNELETIKAFMTDSNKLSTIEKEDYDLDNEGYVKDTNDLRLSINDYKVPGLRINNLERLNSLGDEQKSYENIKQALINLANSTEVDPAEYVSDIEAKIKHKPNKEKLTEVIGYIQSKQDTMSEIENLQKNAKKNKKKIQEKNAEKVELQKKIMGILMPTAESGD